MTTATAATSAADRQSAALRLRELAANLNVHRGFADVVASLKAGHGGVSAEQSFKKLIAGEAEGELEVDGEPTVLGAGQLSEPAVQVRADLFDFARPHARDGWSEILFVLRQMLFIDPGLEQAR